MLGETRLSEFVIMSDKRRGREICKRLVVKVIRFNGELLQWMNFCKADHVVSRRRDAKMSRLEKLTLSVKEIQVEETA